MLTSGGKMEILVEVKLRGPPLSSFCQDSPQVNLGHKFRQQFIVGSRKWEIFQAFIIALV